MGLRERRTSRATTRRPLVVNGFRIFWAVVVVWGELVVYFWSASSCSWPDGQLPATGKPPTHVMLLSDPQVKPPNAIRDDTWLGSLGEIVFDVSIKKSWRVAKRFKPDVVVFLGDMLSGGKYVRSENEYKQYFEKFQDTFPMSNNVSVHYMPGNNDVGMGVSHALSKKVRANYFSAFGPFNYQAIIRDHRFIFLDAPGLVDEDYQRSATGNSYDQWVPVPQGPVEFVQKMSLDDDTKPVVLLTHIPLARPDTGSCGPLREKGTIRRGVGHGYQNTFGKQTTSFLLKTLHPTVVFSGDNRDYCDYTHKASPNDPDSTDDIREVTIKSFSMAQNIVYPGFQLLSLTDPWTTAHHKSYADRPCSLPNQQVILESFYIPLMIVTLAALCFINYTRRRPKAIPDILLSANTPVTPGRASPRWPFAPGKSPISPPSSLPTALRTPNSTAEAGSSFRATSHYHDSTTPLGSPMFHGEEEDVMFPSQYANRDAHDSWSPDHGVGHGFFHNHEPEPPTSVTTTHSASDYKPRRTWSWTFTMLGRRRRITFRAPELSWSAARELLMLVGPGGTSEGLSSRKGVLQSTLIDAISIVWPTTLLWVVLAWMSF